jgi:putative transposase
MELRQRTLKRWRRANGAVKEDQRPQAERVVQPHQLTHAEEAAILDTCNEREYQSLPPSQIVPRLADKGLYLASESSFYRVLKKHQQLNHRGRMKPPRKVPEPTNLGPQARTKCGAGTLVIVLQRCAVSTGICI